VNLFEDVQAATLDEVPVAVEVIRRKLLDQDVLDRGPLVQV